MPESLFSVVTSWLLHFLFLLPRQLPPPAGTEVRNCTGVKATWPVTQSTERCGQFPPPETTSRFSQDVLLFPGEGAAHRDRASPPPAHQCQPGPCLHPHVRLCRAQPRDRGAGMRWHFRPKPLRLSHRRRVICPLGKTALPGRRSSLLCPLNKEDAGDV